MIENKSSRLPFIWMTLDDEEKLYKVRSPVQSNVCSKECFTGGGISPHAGGRRVAQRGHI